MRNGIKLLTTVLLGVSLAQSLSAAQPTAPTAPAPDTFTNSQERASYGIGVLMANSIKRMNVNLDVLVAAMKEVLAGKETKLNEQQAQDAYRKYQQEVQREVADKNLKLGEAFLAANKRKPGVKTHAVTLPDGKTVELQYEVLVEGAGNSPKLGDTVVVNYRGTLIDGKEFDSTAMRGQPATFPVGPAVIRGWTEGLQLMKAGAKWKLYFPADLAYGERGQPAIEPGSMLTFEVELLSFTPPSPAEQAPPSGPPATSDIIKVPSAEEMKAGKKIEVIKADDVQRIVAEQAKTNPPANK